MPNKKLTKTKEILSAIRDSVSPTSIYNKLIKERINAHLYKIYIKQPNKSKTGTVVHIFPIPKNKFKQLVKRKLICIVYNNLRYQHFIITNKGKKLIQSDLLTNKINRTHFTKINSGYHWFNNLPTITIEDNSIGIIHSTAAAAATCENFSVYTMEYII